jgi:hypothetical protein
LEVFSQHPESLSRSLEIPLHPRPCLFIRGKIYLSPSKNPSRRSRRRRRIQHPKFLPFDVGRSMFDVRCSMFDVRTRRPRSACPGIVQQRRTPPRLIFHAPSFLLAIYHPIRFSTSVVFISAFLVPA